MSEIVQVKKNGQTASSRTRKIMNRGNGLYVLHKTSDKDVLLSCTATNWQGWIPTSEIIIDKRREIS